MLMICAVHRRVASAQRLQLRDFGFAALVPRLRLGGFFSTSASRLRPRLRLCGFGFFAASASRLWLRLRRFGFTFLALRNRLHGFRLRGFGFAVSILRLRLRGFSFAISASRLLLCGFGFGFGNFSCGFDFGHCCCFGFRIGFATVSISLFARFCRYLDFVAVFVTDSESSRLGLSRSLFSCSFDFFSQFRFSFSFRYRLHRALVAVSILARFSLVAVSISLPYRFRRRFSFVVAFRRASA